MSIERPDEITPAELKLLTRLQIVSASRQDRARRARKAITDQGKAIAIIGAGANGRPVTFEQAFELVYGESIRG